MTYRSRNTNKDNDVAFDLRRVGRKACSISQYVNCNCY